MENETNELQSLKLIWGDTIVLTTPVRLVSADNCCIYVHKENEPNYEYPIPLNEIKTEAQLIGWIHLLSSKIWITGKHISQLIAISGMHKKVFSD